jgi:hypothetical protein
LSLSQDEYAPLLEPGFHDIPEQQWQSYFVRAFPGSQTRKALLDSLLEFIALIRRCGIRGEAWLDGSFVTDKIDPQDTDVVIFCPPDAPIDAGSVDLLKRLFREGEAKRRFSCDAHLNVDGDIRERAYWRGLLGFMRDEKTPKGIVRFQI